MADEDLLPLCTVADVRLAGRDSTITEDEAELAIRTASGEVRSATGQSFDFVENDVVILNGEGSGTLLLPQTPVSLVSELAEAAGTSREVILRGPLDDFPEWEWSDSGVIRRLSTAQTPSLASPVDVPFPIPGALFAKRYRWYRAIYDHGYDHTPSDVVGIVARISARGIHNADGMRQETIGLYSYTRAGEALGIGLTAGELDALTAYMPDVGIVRGFGGPGSSGSGS